MRTVRVNHGLQTPGGPARKKQGKENQDQRPEGRWKGTSA